MKERIKQKALYLNGRFLSDPQAQPKPEFTIRCSRSEIKYYANTPNTIIYFDHNGQSGFFRECRKHEEQHEYLKRLIADYCQYVFCNEHSKECEALLLEKLNDNNNFIKFFNMGAGTANYTNITKFRKTLNSDYIGIPLPYPDWFKSQLLQLVQFVWGALEEYKYNAFLPLGSYHTYNANRTIVTKRIADMIGGDEIIPDTKYMRLILEGQPRIGVVVGKAPGFSPDAAVEGEILGVTSNFQRQSIILNIADVICYQKDHRPGNYYISTDNNRKAYALSAFDNDCPTTLLPTPNVCFYSYSGYSPFVDKKGRVNRPFLDKECVNLLHSLSEEKLRTALGGNISAIQFRMLNQRVNRLQRAIKESVVEGRTTVISPSEWSEETIAKEVSGEYGQTYVKYFIDKYCEGRE